MPGATTVFALTKVLVFACMTEWEIVEVTESKVAERFVGLELEVASSEFLEFWCWTRDNWAATECKGVDNAFDGEVEVAELSVDKSGGGR